MIKFESKVVDVEKLMQQGFDWNKKHTVTLSNRDIGMITNALAMFVAMTVKTFGCVPFKWWNEKDITDLNNRLGGIIMDDSRN